MRNARTLIDLSYRILGQSITEWGLRKTFFGHFCGGTDLKSVLPTVRHLETFGIGSILDYAAEKDLDDARAEDVISARTFVYEDESKCDDNKDIFKRCIEHVAASSPDAFAAIKVTALGPPELLKRISNVLQYTKQVFRDAARAGTSEESSPAPESGPLGTYRDCQLTKNQLRDFLLQLDVPLAESLVESIWPRLDTTKDDLVSFEEWMSFMNPLNKDAQIIFRAGDLSAKALDEEEVEAMEAMISRLEEIAGFAAERKVRLMIDAEQTYFQDAIDLLVKGLQMRYNREFPSIYGTYQCYLRNALSRVQSDYRAAQAQGFIFAAKLVRGAYMTQERALAKKEKRTDPIWPTLQDTHNSYHSVVDFLISAKSNTVAAMFATHNEDSVRYVVQRMEAEKNPHDGIAFGQLLGMCDHVSITLGAKGYKVYKYVPYGPIKDVVPYLVRRAEENSTLLGSPGVMRERSMILTELNHRLNMWNIKT